MSNYDRLKNIYNKHAVGILPIKSGMLLEIHENIWEWDAKRLWKFKWLVIKMKKPNHPDGTFTIRGEVARMTIEKIYPLSFPNFDKVILLDDYKIRRSKLYYIRDKVGKDARFKSVIENAKKWTDLLDLIKADLKVEEAKEEAVVEIVPEVVEEKVEETIEDKTEEVVTTNEEVKVENVEETKDEVSEENKE